MRARDADAHAAVRRAAHRLQVHHLRTVVRVHRAHRVPRLARRRALVAHPDRHHRRAQLVHRSRHLALHLGLGQPLGAHARVAAHHGLHRHIRAAPKVLALQRHLGPPIRGPARRAHVLHQRRLVPEQRAVQRHVRPLQRRRHAHITRRAGRRRALHLAVRHPLHVRARRGAEHDLGQLVLRAQVVAHHRHPEAAVRGAAHGAHAAHHRPLVHEHPVHVARLG
mmetsp:Transcript_2551/g.7550  ORF Transcript_2551/g.7550 Transcript_2551/m.7550 type:complete len:223 (-) Transcript_2551:1719-2387(-)